MTSRRTPLRAEAGARREQILEATLKIVGERGYHGFGIQELAQRCGLTKPGLLHHFGSKDQLLIALLSEFDARHEAEMARLFAAYFDPEAPKEKLRAMFRESLAEVVRRSLENPALIRMRVMLRAEAINPDHPAHGYFVESEREKLERLARGAAAFAERPRSLARQVVAALDGLEAQWLREEAGFDLLGEWRGFTEALIP